MVVGGIKAQACSAASHVWILCAGSDAEQAFPLLLINQRSSPAA